jgi:hypothetical protein
MATKRTPKPLAIRWVIIGAIAALLTAGALTYFIGNTTKAPAGNEKQQATLEGKMICLPHKNQDGPQTLECAIGFTSDNGKTYAIQSDSPDIALSGAAGSDKKVRITGVVSADDTNSKYKTDGKLRVDHFELVE